MTEKGFVLLSFILFCPILLAISVASAWIFWFLLEKQKLENLCYEYVLKSQEVLVQANNQVLALNPKAWALIIEKKALYVTILTAPPPAAAAASSRLKTVIAQQHTLNRVQKGILQAGNLLTQSHAYTLQMKFRKQFLEIEKHWQQTSGKPNIEIYWKPSQLIPQFQEIAPPYERGKNHSYKQTLLVRWSYPLKNILPTWLKKMISFSKSWKGQCSSQPFKEKYTWLASLKNGDVK